MLRRADEPTEDCSSGAPASGNADCAGVLLPFWSECGSLLDEQSAVYLGVVAECQASAGVGVGSDDGLVHVFERLLCNTSQQALNMAMASKAGDALLLTHPGAEHCGTRCTGWLSGWDQPGAPPSGYTSSTWSARMAPRDLLTLPERHGRDHTGLRRRR